MRIDCHTHTALYSGCSSLNPVQLCALAQERGLQGLVITEHTHQWRRRELAELQSRFAGLTLYSGVEISLREGYDVVLLAGEIQLDLPAYPTAKRLAKALKPHREAVFSFVAHPFRYRNAITPELLKVVEVVEGIEMNSGNILREAPAWDAGRYQPGNNELYEEARERFALAPLFNSDTHTVDSVATVANELPGQQCPSDTAGLSRLLREQTAREWQNTPQLEHFLTPYFVF